MSFSARIVRFCKSSEFHEAVHSNKIPTWLVPFSTDLKKAFGLQGKETVTGSSTGECRKFVFEHDSY